MNEEEWLRGVRSAPSPEMVHRVLLKTAERITREYFRMGRCKVCKQIHSVPKSRKHRGVSWARCPGR